MEAITRAAGFAILLNSSYSYGVEGVRTSRDVSNRAPRSWHFVSEVEDRETAFMSAYLTLIIRQTTTAGDCKVSHCSATDYSGCLPLGSVLWSTAMLKRS